MNYALVTGASKGIGKSIAEVLAAKGRNLLLIARSEDLLITLSKSISKQYGVHTDYLAIDLAAPGAADIIYQWYTSREYSIDILVNNAGYGIWGRFDVLDGKQQQEMLQVNMLTLVQLTYAILPELKRQPKAYILNIASTAAYQAVPTLSLYAASKAFVLLFSRGIRLELKKSPVSVTCVCPGPTSTGFIERAGMSYTIQKKADAFSMTSREVAAIAVKSMFKRKAEVVPGFLNKLIVFFTALVPKALPEKIASDLYKK